MTTENPTVFRLSQDYRDGAAPRDWVGACPHCGFQQSVVFRPVGEDTDRVECCRCERAFTVGYEPDPLDVFDTKRSVVEAGRKWQGGKCVAPFCDTDHKPFLYGCADHDDIGMALAKAQRRHFPEVYVDRDTEPHYNTITAPSGRLVRVRD